MSFLKTLPSTSSSTGFQDGPSAITQKSLEPGVPKTWKPKVQLGESALRPRGGPPTFDEADANVPVGAAPGPRRRTAFSLNLGLLYYKKNDLPVAS